MKTDLERNMVGCTVLVMVLACAAAWPSAAAEKSAARAPTKAAPRVKFRPKTTVAGSVRVTGGSRGAGEALTTLDVLVPDAVGLTTQEQPSLFWFQSKPADVSLELTLLQQGKVKPLLRIYVDHYTNSGIQRVKLSDYGVKLQPGIEYQWVVALISDPENRSTDLVASGVIKRVEPSPTLREKLSHSSPQSLASVYAEEGIWYDSLAALSDQIEREPENHDLREARADLLRQVGLKAAAGVDDSFARR